MVKNLSQLKKTLKKGTCFVTRHFIVDEKSILFSTV